MATGYNLSTTVYSYLFVTVGMHLMLFPTEGPEPLNTLNTLGQPSVWEDGDIRWSSREMRRVGEGADFRFIEKKHFSVGYQVTVG